MYRINPNYHICTGFVKFIHITDKSCKANKALYAVGLLP